MMNKTKLKITVQEPQHARISQGQKDLSFLQNARQCDHLVHSYFEQDLLYVLWDSSLPSNENLLLQKMRQEMKIYEE